jgi:hypothetical protein
MLCGLSRVLGDNKNKFQLRTALEILSRVDPAALNVSHDHHHEHVHRHDRDADVQSLRFLRDVCGVPRQGLENVFGFSGLSIIENREKLQKALLIEGEVVATSDDDPAK